MLCTYFSVLIKHFVVCSMSSVKGKRSIGNLFLLLANRINGSVSTSKCSETLGDGGDAATGVDYFQLEALSKLGV
ncbi:hypothetical protein Ancab_013549 [Ancistrocladus abbreviatus]